MRASAKASSRLGAADTAGRAPGALTRTGSRDLRPLADEARPGTHDDGDVRGDGSGNGWRRRAGLAITVAVLVSLAGCGGGSDDDAGDGSSVPDSPSEAAGTTTEEPSSDGGSSGAFPVPCDHLAPDEIATLIEQPVVEIERFSTDSTASCTLDIGAPDGSFEVDLRWARPEDGSENLFSAAGASFEGTQPLPEFGDQALDVPFLNTTMAATGDLQFSVQAFGLGSHELRVEVFRRLVSAFPG